MNIHAGKGGAFPALQHTAPLHPGQGPIRQELRHPQEQLPVVQQHRLSGG